MESNTRALLEEQRNQFIAQAKFEILLQATKVKNAVQSLQRQLRSQDTELYIKSRDCEASRQEQALMRTELQSRERAFGNLLLLRCKEMEALKEILLFSSRPGSIGE